MRHFYMTFNASQYNFCMRNRSRGEQELNKRNYGDVGPIPARAANKRQTSILYTTKEQLHRSNEVSFSI